MVRNDLSLPSASLDFPIFIQHVLFLLKKTVRNEGSQICEIQLFLPKRIQA